MSVLTVNLCMCVVTVCPQLCINQAHNNDQLDGFIVLPHAWHSSSQSTSEIVYYELLRFENNCAPEKPHACR